MISLTIPSTKDDRTAVIDMAADCTDEYLDAHDTLPPSSLLTTDTLTLLVRRNGRTVGALSMATGAHPDTTELRSEINTVYIVPKQRGKGYAQGAVSEFTANAPHPAFVRGPLSGAMEHIVKSLELPTGDVHDLCMLPTVTEAFLNTVPCEHKMEPCRSCVHTQLRGHFTRTYDQLAQQMQGAIVEPSAEES